MRKTYKNKHKYSKTNKSSKSRKMYKRRRVGGSGGMLPLIPGPFVGSSYNGSSGNHYSLNNYPTDIQLQIQNGGKRKRTKRRKYRGRGGSSIIPSQISYGVGNFYDKLFGYHTAVNPSPLVGQLPNTYFKPNPIY